jgi:membrane protease YdiL (CAAX protease family)
VNEYALIAATPFFWLAVGLAIVRFRKLDWAEDVGFRLPSLRDLLIWTAAFVAYAAAVEVFGGGESMAGSWKGKYDATGIAVRIAAIALVYPVAEEFFFRGVFIGVARRRIGNALAVIAAAVVFGLIHVQYDWPVWIVADGLFFGLARVMTRSVYVPMLLHVLGNSYAVWERLQ